MMPSTPATAHTVALQAADAQVTTRLALQTRARYLARRMETLTNAERDWAGVALPQETLDSVLKLVDLFASGRTPSPKDCCWRT